jgi:hypothetical protein
MLIMTSVGYQMLIADVNAASAALQHANTISPALLPTAVSTLQQCAQLNAVIHHQHAHTIVHNYIKEVKH